MKGMSVRTRVALVVTAAWVLVGIVWGSHATFGASLQGNPTPFKDAASTALINSLPWIPITLVIIALTVRFPVRRPVVWRNLAVHLAAYPVLAFFAHVLVVLGFWTRAGSFQGPEALMRGALFWTSMRIHIAAVLYVVIAGATEAAVHYRDSQRGALRIARLEGQLATARLEALNAQLRPHFLFNTLHTMGHLWRSGRSGEADRLLDHLGALFQRVQSTTSEREVLLAEELAMVEDYLAIESARFPDRLRVSVSATEEARACQVPPLMLQPLVENAIRHGISQRSAAGSVLIEASVVGGALEIAVEDDGPGLVPDSPTRGSGTGHENLRRRLQEMYGAGAELTPQSVSGGGFRVVVTLPARPEAAPAKSARVDRAEGAHAH